MLQLQECLKPSPRYILPLKKIIKQKINCHSHTIFRVLHTIPNKLTELQFHSKESIPNC